MLPYLDISSPFPDANKALIEPNGLLAAGADLSPQRLVDAYSKGIFPWFSDDEPILWWSPNPRTIFDLETWQPSKSLCRLVRRQDFLVTLNRSFAEVMQACSEPRENQPGTWITDEMKHAYTLLHQQGYAHSLEVWQSDQLVGGIYGVSIGRIFCGESMFSRIDNGSKIALACLIGYLRPLNFPIIDCQVENPHLMSLGAINMNREDYLTIISENNKQSISETLWTPKILNAKTLVVRTPK